MRPFLLAAIALSLAVPAVARAADPAPAPSPSPVASPAAGSLPPPAPLDPRLDATTTPAASRATGGSLLLGDGPLAPARAPARPGRLRVAAMIAVPAGCMAVGGAAWAGLANQTGDVGTPALEMGAGYAGSWAASAGVALAVFAVDRDAFTPAKNRAGFKDAGWTVLGSAVLVPVVAGGSTFAAGEALEGRSPHPVQAAGAAIGGAALGELLTGGAAALLRTPATSGPVSLAFVPVGAGSALGYRLGRGRFGRERALIHAPWVVLSARF